MNVADTLDYKFKLDEEFSGKVKLPVDVKVLKDAPAWFTLKVLRGGKSYAGEGGRDFREAILEGPRRERGAGKDGYTSINLSAGQWRRRRYLVDGALRFDFPPGRLTQVDD